MSLFPMMRPIELLAMATCSPRDTVRIVLMGREGCETNLLAAVRMNSADFLTTSAIEKTSGIGFLS